MGVFDDKKFEELDWISVAMEPIDSELNDILAELPEIVEIDFKTYRSMVSNSHGIDLSLDRAVQHMISVTSQKHISWKARDVLVTCFTFEHDDDLMLDFEKKIITGKLRLVKVIGTMDEKTLAGMLGSEGIDQCSSMSFHGAGITRANEIMELLGKCSEGMKTRSDRRKRHAIVQRLRQLFKDNEWKIKDTELANKVGYWICEYITEGNLAAFSNFCRLKVMTHKDQPIYSMEEVK